MFCWRTLYLLVAAPLLVTLVFLFPPGEGPDEATQIARAASVLRAQAIGHRERLPHPSDGAPVDVAGMDINPGFLAPLLVLPPAQGSDGKPVTRAMMDKLAAKTWPTGRDFIEASNTASYAPVFYIPAALGLGVARLAGAKPLATIYAGRLTAALVCLGLGWLALRLANTGHAALFALLTLPMTLHLGSVVNQDGPLIATAALAAALFTRTEPLSRYLAIIALACICAAKPTYLPFAALALLPIPGDRRRWRWSSHAGAAALIILAALAWAAVAATFAAVPFWRPPYHPGPLWPGDPATSFRTTDPGAQLQTLIHAPLTVLALPFTTFAAEWGLILTSMIGELGPLDFTLPNALYQAWHVALGATAAGMLLGIRHAWPALLTVVAGLAAIYATYLVQYFAWTNVGADHIDGVQGRYAIPVLVLMAAFLPLPSGPVWLRRTLAAPAVVAALLTAATLPAAVVLRYYLR